MFSLKPVYISVIHITIILVMTSIVNFTRALADPTRWRIVRLVMNQATGVRERPAACDKPKGKPSFN